MDPFIQINRDNGNRTMTLEDPFSGSAVNSNSGANEMKFNIVKDSKPSSAPLQQPMGKFTPKMHIGNSNNKNVDWGFDFLSNPKKKSHNDKELIDSELASELSGEPSLDNISVDDDSNGNFFGNSNNFNSNNLNSNNYSNNFSNNFSNNNAYEESQYSGSGSESASGSESESDDASQVSYMSEAEIYRRKKECLWEIRCLQRKGVSFERQYDENTPLKEMMRDLEIIKRERSLQKAVKFQQKLLLLFAAGTEWITEKFDHPLGVDLDGWSESILENLDEYDEIFEELYYKYKERVNVSPEIKLLMTLGGSAIMFASSKKYLGGDKETNQYANMTNMPPRGGYPPMSMQMPNYGYGMPGMQGMMHPGMMNGMSGMRMGGPPMGPPRRPDADQMRYESQRQMDMDSFSRPAPAEKNVSVNSRPQREMKGPRGVDDILNQFDRKPNKKSFDDISIDDNLSEVLSDTDRLDSIENTNEMPNVKVKNGKKGGLNLKL